jgi:threonine/homoserine/homoserine lactone efflux protein
MGAWAILIGWIVATITFSAENAAGALVITSGVRAAVYVIGGVILGAFAATLPVRKVVIDPTAPVN